ncbi:MAG: porin [Rhodobacteraceae bacterium]|nr:porin [Paracoccaceae bacterium]
MKKILLASTALVLSAVAANAQAFNVTGEGRMGLRYNNSAAWAAANAGSAYMVENRLTLNFNVAVEADHGLSFGAFTRARMQMGGGAPAVYASNQTAMFSGSRVWVEANGLRLTFGNQDGAIVQAGVAYGYAGGCGVGYVGGELCGDTAGLFPVAQLFNSVGPSGPQMVALTYNMGDIRFALSNGRGASTELGIRGSFDAFTVALGYTNNRGASGNANYVLSGQYNGGSWTVGALVAKVDDVTNTAGATVTTWNLRGTVALGGGNLYGYVGRTVTAATAAASTDPSYGLSYGYGLGGGATLTVGAERIGGATNTTAASVGVAFTF